MECRAVLRRHDPRIRREGRVTVKLETLKELNAERAARRPAIVVTDTESGEQRLVKAKDFAADPLSAELSRQLRMGKSGNVEVGGKKLFLNVYAPTARMVIVGAVHISQALVPLARSLGYDVTVVDPRTAFASPERFPDVPLIAEWPDVALPPLNIDHYTAFRGADARSEDRRPRAAARVCSRLLLYRRTRFTKDARQARRAPEGARRHRCRPRAASMRRSGSAIGAVSPSEIAVSIMAEITASLRMPKESKEAAA